MTSKKPVALSYEIMRTSQDHEQCQQSDREAGYDEVRMAVRVLTEEFCN